MLNPQACGGVCGRIRSRRTVPQWANTGTPKNYTPWTRFYRSTNPNKNRQLCGWSHRYRYSETKKVQGNGNATLSDERQVKTKLFFVYWKPEIQNMGGYFTKHHPPHHNREICAKYLYMANALLKNDHKIVYKWSNPVLTPIHTVAVTPINTVAITQKRTVLQWCTNVLRMYGHKNNKTLM